MSWNYRHTVLADASFRFLHRVISEWKSNVIRLVVTLKLAFALGLFISSARAQNEPDYEATIAALETQVAELSPTLPVPETRSENITPEERQYLSTVAKTLQALDNAEI
jgi:hypothetical protein